MASPSASSPSAIKKVCPQCGKVFYVWPYEQARRTFCSKDCMGIWYSKHHRGEDHPNWTRVQKVCPICGRTFEVPRCRLESNTYCSVECRDKGKSETMKGEKNWNYGKDLSGSLNPSWQGGPITKVCVQCGKEFLVDKYRDASAKFCSKTCLGKWQSAHIVGANSPTWKGGYETRYGPNWSAQRRKARERDKVCQFPGCRKTAKTNGRALSVHHVIPFRTFKQTDGTVDYLAANSLTNLCCYCEKHHKVVENRDFAEQLLL